MEFISREGGSNCYVVAGFMDIFMISEVNNNKKWIKILGDFWVTIKDVALEKCNRDAWVTLGELIESNLKEDWKNDYFESQLMERYCSFRWYQQNLQKHEKFKKYSEYFKQKNIDEEDNYYDYDYDREEFERKVREDDYDDYED
jgi:hypothetical protein